MPARTLFFVAFFTSLLVAGATAWFVNARLEADAPRTLDPAALDRVHDRLKVVERDNGELRTTLDEIRQAVRRTNETLVSRSGGGATATEEAAAAAVEKDGAARGAGAASKPAKPLTAAEVMRRLAEDDLSDMETEQLWHDAITAGLMDEIIKAYEKRVKADPNNPDLQTELAEAYINKITEVGNGPMAGVYGMKADKAYDAALAADPEHWDARFGKAIALSFWPPALGKQGEAIKQFETLLEKQARQASRPEFAHTFLFLGNMYAQQGKTDLAIATWKKGLVAFPDHSDLTNQISNATK
jgi:tetratricopeptide (TPR) repeat protein